MMPLQCVPNHRCVANESYCVPSIDNAPLTDVSPTLDRIQAVHNHNGYTQELGLYPGFLPGTIHCTENPIKYSHKWNCGAWFPFPIFMYLWSIYIFPESVCLFGCSKIRQNDPGNIQIAHRYMIVEIGTEHYNLVSEITRPHSFISRNRNT